MDRAILEPSAKLLLALASANLLVEAAAQPGRTCFSRVELEQILAPLRDPEGTAAIIEDAAERQLAIEDHYELLRCDWSPLPLLDAIFGAKATFLQRVFGKAPPEPPEWEEVDLSQAAIVESYLERVSPIIEAIEARMAAGQKGGE